jgi:penicillin-insensitive murein endopeptidase
MLATKVPLTGYTRGRVHRAFAQCALLLSACSGSPGQPGEIVAEASRATPVSVVLPDPAPGAVPSGAVVVLEPVAIAPRHALRREYTKTELTALMDGTGAESESIALGAPNRGALRNAERMPEERRWRIVNPERSYATRGTIATLRRCLEAFYDEHAEAPPLMLGDFSARDGGYVRPHMSHQSGLDVDLGYFYRGEARWYERATRDNLDLALTWALVRRLIAEGDVEYIFMDSSVQALLREHALASEPEPRWLDTVFEQPANKNTLIRHRWGHASHLHVRFYDNVATRLGELARPVLAKKKAVHKPVAKRTPAKASGAKAPKQAKQKTAPKPAVSRSAGSAAQSRTR